MSAKLRACNEIIPTGIKIREDQVVQLPSRVIDVRPAVHFLQETTHSEVGTYVTLSHVWGNPYSIPELALSTFEDKKSRIPLEILPRTFKDAILITRNPDIPYLWIDSLCIIQDDGADKERQFYL
jgi:Heterokaryon incompatibility protein (HET)